MQKMVMMLKYPSSAQLKVVRSSQSLAQKEKEMTAKETQYKTMELQLAAALADMAEKEKVQGGRWMGKRRTKLSTSEVQPPLVYVTQEGNLYTG